MGTVIGFSTNLLIVLIVIYGFREEFPFTEFDYVIFTLGQGFGGNCGFLRSKNWL